METLLFERQTLKMRVAHERAERTETGVCVWSLSVFTGGPTGPGSEDGV